MRQRGKLRLNHGETDFVEIGRGIRQGCFTSPILFNVYGEYLMKEKIDDVGDFKIGRMIINKMRFADETAIRPIDKAQEEL